MKKHKSKTEYENPYIRETRRIFDAKRSGSIAKIFDAYKATRRKGLLDLSGKFHGVTSLYSAPPVGNDNLVGELIWGSVILRNLKDDISAYIYYKLKMASLIQSSNWKKAHEETVKFELGYGASLIAHELYVALIQQSEGTVKQVAYLGLTQSK